MPVSAVQQIDGNYKVITSNEAFLLSSSWTFSTLTTGAVGAHTLFNVTGDVLAGVFYTCQTSVETVNGTLSVGVSGSVDGLMIAIDGFSVDAGLAVNRYGAIANPTFLEGDDAYQSIIAGGADIIATIATAVLSAGAVTFYCLWRPLSTDGRVTVTTPA